MHLANFSLRRETSRRIGVREDNRMFDLSRAYERYLASGQVPFKVCPDVRFSVLDLIKDQGQTCDMVSSVMLHSVKAGDAGLWHALSDIRFHPPLENPAKIICVGLNFREHAASVGLDPSSVTRPVAFTRLASSLNGHLEPVVIPEGVHAVDYEIELAAVLGRGGRRISEADAAKCIAGYTILNDMASRDLQQTEMTKGLLFACKNIDTFGPMGPHLTLSSAIKDPAELRLTLKVNEEIRQDAPASEMIFTFPELIAYWSRYLTLQPGDILTSGTPSGIALRRRWKSVNWYDAAVGKPGSGPGTTEGEGYLQPGDTVVAEISCIGTLMNPIVADA